MATQSSQTIGGEEFNAMVQRAKAAAWPEGMTSDPHRNTSGFTPLDLRVLVLPDPVADKTAGGIYLPDQTKEADRWATTMGTLVALGANAFAESSDRETTPKPGDRVLFAKYGNRSIIKGADGETYWVMNDEDILCLKEAI